MSSEHIKEQMQDVDAAELKIYKGIPDEILEVFPIDVYGNMHIGEYMFSAEEISGGKVVDAGSMNRVIILPERKLVLKFNKKRRIPESYEDVKKQIEVFENLQKNHPEITFHFAKTEVFQSKEQGQEEYYGIVSEYVEGRHVKMSDIKDNPAIRKQILDLAKMFELALRNKEYPIVMDLMGAKQGFQCLFYGLEVMPDFELGNFILTPDGRVVMIDTGLSFGKQHSIIRNLLHMFTYLGQKSTIYHMNSMAKGEPESFIR